ncbi:MAG: hypothetical protein V1702_00260 [Candidatus Woesearchaeota archaeon]
MAIFGKPNKKDNLAPEPTEATPTDQVVKLRQQGLSNNQIVQSLQRSGYKTQQIFDAMNQADMLSAAPVDLPHLEDEEAEMDMPLSKGPELKYPGDYPTGPSRASSGSAADEKIEEIAEAIIEEKWEELVKNVTKIVKWKESVEQRIVDIEKEYDALRKDFEGINKSLMDKLEKYDDNIGEVGTTLKAMEQVFTKVLPTLTSNVNELSRITRNVESKAQKK